MVQSGLNTELPEAKFNTEEKQDKFSIYEASEKDETDANSSADDIFESLSFSNANDEELDINEEQITSKLAKIEEQINSPTLPESEYTRAETSAYESSSNITKDVERLEKLMLSFQAGEEEDKEMEQLNEVLDKILKIQYPDLETKDVPNESVDMQNSVYALGASSDNPAIVNEESDSKKGNTIQATIHEDQDIVSGSVIKLRLLDSIHVNGVLIPRNRFVYGVATIDDERLKINIASLRYQNSILPIALSAYDLDGLEGLYIPGAITRDASKDGVNDAIQSLQVMSLDPSLSAQVAGAGVDAAKGLFRKKVKQVRVKVKAGYQLLLRDKNIKNH
ncbi:conjugative transposon protein TraM [Albibacterium bauzanense]|uniref:conjugative transposon protein TraM n=1 Tax=Albibacterium bauzanense TaxID=653929 RepID=UPI0014055ABA|nr:conjugative transposon protein TraM [Albibacterium bauzanense]